MTIQAVFSQLVFSAVLIPLLYGCRSSAASGPGPGSDSAPPTASETQKSLIAEVSGDSTMHFVAKDDDVNVGFLPTATKGEFRFNVGASKESADQTVAIDTGISSPFKFTTGAEQDAGGGRFGITRNEVEKAYTDSGYRLFFDTNASTHSNGHIRLTKADKLQSGNKMLVRYHLVGSFQFDAANRPDQLGGPCVQEAQAYAIAHGAPRYPQYTATLCGAKKVHVDGTFDVLQDFLASAF